MRSMTTCGIAALLLVMTGLQAHAEAPMGQTTNINSLSRFVGQKTSWRTRLQMKRRAAADFRNLKLQTDPSASGEQIKDYYKQAKSRYVGSAFERFPEVVDVRRDIPECPFTQNKMTNSLLGATALGTYASFHFFGKAYAGSVIGTPFDWAIFGLGGLALATTATKAYRRASSLAREVTVAHAVRVGVPVGKDLLEHTKLKVVKHYGALLDKAKGKSRAELLDEVAIFKPLFQTPEAFSPGKVLPSPKGARLLLLGAEGASKKNKRK